MLKAFKRHHRIISHALPSLFAISIAELVNIEVFFFGPISHKAPLLFGWQLLQFFAAFTYGYISDFNLRKKTLVVSQIIGFAGGVTLLTVGFNVWVVILIALTFNPQAVARAALLDNYKQYSSLKIIAVTFIAQWIPWAFFAHISKVPYQKMVFWILIALAVNALLTVFFFQDLSDEHEKKREPDLIKVIKERKGLLFTLAAFTLSELTFFINWEFMEAVPEISSWLEVTTFGTLVGILISMLYSRLPHMSIITLLYSIGAGIMFVTYVTCSRDSCTTNLIGAMSHYVIIGGLYIPFVTDAVINMVGSRHKGVGAAAIEGGQTLAALIAPISKVLFKENSSQLLLAFTLLYILATASQKAAEKHHRQHI